jgi:hypothetical protein
VLGVGSSLVLVKMAVRAIVRDPSEAAIYMTLGATGSGVTPGQRKLAVIELRATPLHRRVTCGTILRETGSGVIRVRKWQVAHWVAKPANWLLVWHWLHAVAA